MRAGLELVDTIAKVAANTESQPRVRVGIHTGDT